MGGGVSGVELPRGHLVGVVDHGCWTFLLKLEVALAREWNKGQEHFLQGPWLLSWAATM